MNKSCSWDLCVGTMGMSFFNHAPGKEVKSTNKAEVLDSEKGPLKLSIFALL
ncbi:hypothetical protein [Peribacillus simplex]|uniref:hypothetical protein n=1 Tax=Peribacillus simplex TaxID=1478 RepID=UPI00162534B7|nr:hypothetical protein [Peribacillus simplex]